MESLISVQAGSKNLIRNSLYFQAGFVVTNYGNPDYGLLNPQWLFASNQTSLVDNTIGPGMTRNYRVKVGLPDGDWIWSNFAQATALYC